MELINGGSLKDFYKQKRKNKRVITELEASQIMMGLMKAVEYLHKKDIIHRDIKPGILQLPPPFQLTHQNNFSFIDNILIMNKNDLTTIKLVDFGLSGQLDISVGNS